MGLGLTGTLESVFKYKDKEVSKEDTKYGLKAMESSGGINIEDRYEPEYHKKLIEKYDKGTWSPTPAEKRIIKEKGLDEALKSFSTSKGAFQILPETAYRYTSFSGDPEDLKDPEISNKVADELLDKFHESTGGDLEKTIHKWNQGEDYFPKFKKILKDKGLDLSILNPFSVKEAEAGEASKLGLKGKLDDIGKLGLSGSLDEPLDPKDSLSFVQKALTSKPVDNVFETISGAMQGVKNFFSGAIGKLNELEDKKSRSEISNWKKNNPGLWEKFYGDKTEEELFQESKKEIESAKEVIKSAALGAAEQYTFGIVPTDKELAEKHPIAYSAGQLGGGVASLMTVGGILQGVGLANQAAKAGQAALAVSRLGPRFVPRLIMTGATFGTHTAIKEIVNQAQEGRFDPVEAGTQVAKDTALGGLLGIAGGVSNVVTASTIAAGLGYSSSKMDGADEQSALLNGAIWGIFELVGSSGRERKLRVESVKNLKRSLADYAQTKKAMPRETAENLAGQFIEREASKAGGIDKVLESRENNLDFLESLNQNIFKKTQGIKPEVEPLKEIPFEDIVNKTHAEGEAVSRETFPTKVATEGGEVVPIKPPSEPVAPLPEKGVSIPEIPPIVQPAKIPQSKQGIVEPLIEEAKKYKTENEIRGKEAKGKKIYKTLGGQEVYSEDGGFLWKPVLGESVEVKGKRLGQGEGKHGTYYNIMPDLEARYPEYKGKLEEKDLKLKNVLKVEKVTNETYPIKDLFYRWFDENDLISEMDKSGLSSDEAMDKLVAEEAVKKGYDGIQFGNQEIVDLTAQQGKGSLTAAEAVKQGMGAEEYIKSKQPKTIKLVSAKQSKDYMGGHEAPMAEDINAPIWDLTGEFTGKDLYPKDVYGGDARRLYSSGSDFDNEAMSILQSVRKHPNRKVTVYRAVPKDVKGEINAGDWVTITRGYAKEHGESNLGNNFKIIKKEVFARDIFTDANSIQEFGYDPQPRLEPKDTPYELLSKAYKERKTDLHSTYQSQLLSEYEAAKGLEPINKEIDEFTGEKQGVVKEPWEMTKQEFRKDWLGEERLKSHELAIKKLPEAQKKYESYRQGFIKRWEGEGNTRQYTSPQEFKKESAEVGRLRSRVEVLKYRITNVDSIHEVKIKEALSQGKPVPPEVLVEYPDMAKVVSTEKPSSPTITQPAIVEPGASQEEKIPTEVPKKGEKAVFKISKKADVWNVPVAKTLKPGQPALEPKFIGGQKKITSEKVQQIYQDTLTDIEFSEEGDFVVIKGYPKKELTAKEKKSFSQYGSVGTFSEEIKQATVKEAEIKAVETIEIIQLAKTLMEDYPIIRNLPKSMGLFNPEGKGTIKLTPGLFKRGQEKQLAATLAHEIGHLVDYLPDYTMRRGNILGRIASLRDYFKNFLPRLSTQSREYIITPQDRERIKKEVEKGIGKRPVDSQEIIDWRKIKKEDRGQRPEDSPAVSEWKCVRSEKYAEAVIAEADKRGLITQKELRDELIKMSFEWRPFEEAEGKANPDYLMYRSSAKEIYADAVSALLNNPGYVQTKCPIFFESFFEYLDRKPEIKEAYIAAQKMMNGTPGDIITARQQNTRTMFAKGETIREKLENEYKLKENNVYERLRQMFVDKYYPILKKLEASNRNGVIPKSETAHLLQELDLVQNGVYLLTQKIDQTVVSPLKEAGANLVDLSEYMFLKRIIGRTSISNEEIKAMLKDVGIEDMFGSLGIEIVDTKAEAKAKQGTVVRQEGGTVITEETPVTSWEEQITKWKEKNADREDLANPLGFSPETAQKQIDFLKSQIGDTAFNAIEQSADKYHDLIFAVARDAVQSGVYSQKVFDTVIVPNKNYYVTFGVLDYLDRTVPSGIKAQIGTLKEVESPFITTILKTISLIHANAKNKAIASAINELEALYPNEVTKTKQVIIGGIPARFANPKKDLGQVRFMVDGKLVSYDVDKYIAESFARDNPTLISLGAGLNKMLGNKYFKGLVITYSPAFQVFNIQRDFKRTYISLNALGQKVTVAKLLKEYWKALPIAARRLTGVSDPVIECMMENKALDVPFNDFNYDDRNDGFAKLLRKYNVIGPQMKAKTVREKILNVAMRVDAAIRFVGNAIETLPKVSGYNIMKEKGVSDREIGYITREYVGTPNFRNKGSLTNISNELFIFSNIMIQGTRADLRLATCPLTRSGYWWADFKMNHALKLLMIAAATGLGGALLKDWFDKVPEYDKTNYIIIPVGVDKEGRARYFRVPHNETSRIFSAMLWKIGTAIGKTVSGEPQPKNAFEGVFSIAGGQLPGIAPAISVATAWGSYLSGKNPYDSFRGRYAIPDQAFDAGEWPKLKNMVQYTTNELGLSQFTTYDDRRDTTFEATMKATPFLNSIFRIIKTSDYGLKERTRNIAEEGKRETAQRSLKRFNLFEEKLKGYSADDISKMIDSEGGIKGNAVIKKDLEDITSELYGKDYEKKDFKTTEKAFLRYILRESNEPFIDGILSAQRNSEKIEILKEAKETLSESRYNEIINKLRKTNIVSKDVVNAVK